MDVLCLLIKINHYMQVFRKKYLFNPENPIYESENVLTYNCMNTETKDNKLIILKHLKEPPFVDPTPGVLQPIEEPTTSEPFSVYPLVYCCSEIGKVNQSDAMYILKCLIESKMKQAFYYVLSPQGICASDVEGLLPNRSPPLFEIAIQLLDVPASLVDQSDKIVSREAFQICKGIRDGQNVNNLLSNYGWNTPKKEKDIVKDDQFWIFKGKRKDEGPFGEQYSLAWFSKFGLVRFRYLDLSKDGFQEQFLQDFNKKIAFFQNNQSKEVNTISIFKAIKQPKGYKLFYQILNQGTITQYLQRRKATGKILTQEKAITMLSTFVNSMLALKQQPNISGHGAIHAKNIYIHDHRLVIGEPLFVTDRVEKKLRQLKNTFDFYAPQMKQNIILPENLFKLSFEKMDIWSFGFLAHKILTGDLPTFNATRAPVIKKTGLNSAISDIITRCLSVNPALRPTWEEIDLKNIKTAVRVQQIQQDNNSSQREVIRLGTGRQKPSQKSQMHREKSAYESLKAQQIIHISEVGKEKQQQEILHTQKEQQQEKFVAPIPVQLSLRLKRIKLISKVIIVMVLYIFVFFRGFLGNSLSIMFTKDHYKLAKLNLVDNTDNILSSTVVITDDPNYFLLNDISFMDISNTYNCIDNQFDPIYNPNYSLIEYVQSSSFQALLISGWVAFFLICTIKAISIWKGGLSNRPKKGICKYMVVYGFHELSLASLLFAHFYIFQFFYFAGASPCFSIQSYQGTQPLFDSSLYLFLMKDNGYLTNVFSSLGILSILVFLSSCYYAWGPKLDHKYFLSIPSILFRIIPYILFILICRVGVFLLFSPTAINDTTGMINSIVTKSATGFFGIIPEVFVAICLVGEGVLQAFFHWCQSKAAESDRLAGLFNIHKKKIGGQEQGPKGLPLREMSIAKSQMKLNDDELFE